MKLKHLILAAALLAGFAYYTSSTARRTLPALQPAPKSALADSSTATPQRGESSLGTDERNNIEIYRDASPAVVNIVTKTMSYDFFSNEYPTEGAGSGFLIDDAGHIVTNNHVVAGAKSVS